MKKIIDTKDGYALTVVLVTILVLGLLTPVMLTAATYGMKNTINTNNNFNARYIADSAYQENLYKVNSKKESGTLLHPTDINTFINNEIINTSGITLNGGTYTTILHPDYPTNPKVVSPYNGNSNETMYTYYLRSTGDMSGQSAIVDYSISFKVTVFGGTTILYGENNEPSTYYRLPDNLKKFAKAEKELNQKVHNDIDRKFKGTSSPNIEFRYNLTPTPAFYKNELTDSETINKDIRVSKVDLKNNESITINGDLYVDNDFTVKNNVSVTVKGNLYIGTNFNVGNNAVLKVKGDVIVKNSIKFNNNIHFDIDGSMFVQGELTVENNATNSKISGSLYVKNNINLENNGQLKVTNDIVGNNITLKNNNLLKTGGEVLVKNEFQASNNAYVELAGGLEAGTQLKLSNNVEFRFAQKLYITNVLELGNNAKMILIETGGAGSKNYLIDVLGLQKI